MSENEVFSSKIDSLFEKWNTNNTPGCCLGVIRNGEFLFKKNYGLRNLDDRQPITSSTIFDIASISKQFTAACVALLHLRKEISLNNSLKELLPDVNFDQNIKIHHLIHHESGIKDYQQSLILLNYSWDEIVSLSKEQLFEFINNSTQLDFTPGSQHIYTNTNYFLLGLVVEQVTGKSLAEFAEQEFFSPLGMKHTSFVENYHDIVNDKATGYSPTDYGYVENISKAKIIGPRGVFTSVDDLLLWDQNFFTRKVGGKEFVELLEKPSREYIIGLSSNRWGVPTQHQGYAFGLLTDFYRGLKIIRHGGDFAGYTAEMLRFPTKQLTIIILTNCSTINPTTLAFKTADVILAEEFQSKSPYTWKSSKQLENEETDNLVGNYYDRDFNSYFTIFRENNKLIIGNDWLKSELKAVSDDTFVAINQPSLLLVRPKEKGIIIETEFYTADIPKFTPISLENKKLVEYSGTYHNEQFNRTLTIIAEVDSLEFILKCGEQIIKPSSQDAFRNGFLQLEFHRKNSGISFVKINSYGSKGILYEKLE